jgi:hypothetical protein
MQIAEIPRIKPGQEIDFAKKQLSVMDQERLELGNKAASVLGYRGLKSEVTGQIVVPLEDLGELGKALLVLDIEILDAGSVLKYQQDEICRRNTDWVMEQVRSNQLTRMVTWGWNLSSWQHTKIADYGQPIPEFVLHKAVQIKEKLPKVEFHIQHLTDPKADPFLIAVLGKELYFIEAWDEPRFEGRLSR